MRSTEYSLAIEVDAFPHGTASYTAVALEVLSLFRSVGAGAHDSSFHCPCLRFSTEYCNFSMSFLTSPSHHDDLCFPIYLIFAFPTLIQI